MGELTKETKRSADYMALALARLLKDSRNVFHGLASPLPAVAVQLARRIHNPNLLYLNIAGGVDAGPEALQVSTCGPSFLEGTQSFFSLTDIFDLCARGELDTAFLSGVQIDSQGRVNNSVIGSFTHPKVRLPGGAGSAVIIPHAQQTILWRTKHDKRTFVEKLDFITAAGNTRYVVSPLGILVKAPGPQGNKLYLQSYFSYSSPQEIQDQTGFPLPLAATCAAFPDPTAEELQALEDLDPQGVRYSEF